MKNKDNEAKNHTILKEEIDILQNKLDIINKINTKNSIKRKAIKGLYYLRRLLPYLLTTGVTFGTFSLFRVTPFIKDNYNATLEIKKEIDSKKETKIEEQYKRTHNIQATLKYVSEWTKEEDGTYTREIKDYVTNTIEEDVITKIVKDIDIESLEEIFGTPVVNKKEKRSDLTIYQIKTKPHMHAIIYIEDKNNFITVTESNKKNLIYTTIWIIINLYTNALLYDEIMKETKGNYKKTFEKKLNIIDEEYPSKNTKEIVRKLELKKEQYKKYSK